MTHMTKEEFLNLLDKDDAMEITKQYLVEMNPTKSLEVVNDILAMLNKNPKNISMVYRVALDHFCIKTQLAFLKDTNGTVIKRF